MVSSFLSSLFFLRSFFSFFQNLWLYKRNREKNKLKYKIQNIKHDYTLLIEFHQDNSHVAFMKRIDIETWTYQGKSLLQFILHSPHFWCLFHHACNLCFLLRYAFPQFLHHILWKQYTGIHRKCYNTIHLISFYIT